MDKQLQKKRKKRIIRRRTAAFAGFLVGASFFAGGCQIPVFSTSAESESYVFQIGNEQCPVQEAKVILLNYQKDCASLYGVDMWSHDYEEGESLEDYVKDLAVSQLAEVYTLDIVAGEQELSLTSDEESQAKAAAKEYIRGLSDAERDYLGVNTGSVQQLFERYALAKKLYDALTESVSTEVSDDEARVMIVKQASVMDADTAENIVSALESGTEFEAAAVSYSGNVKTVQVNRTTFEDAVTEALFDLDTGEYSDVISVDGAYCVFYCVSPFDLNLTDQNKEKVLKQRMDDVVSVTYASYTDQLASDLNEDVWDEISVDTSLELSESSFMDVFETYFESF